ncbi:MAG: PD-(D/E)XK nuclease family protein, partial [Synergistaceae bacterium]|nr:PD-(D/E)XK nuclease family protein [Synergistaceae bacterium]
RLINFQAEIIARLYENNFRHVDIMLEDDARLKIPGKNFYGQCDRIEILASNNTGEKFAVITDYKHGKSEKYESKRKINLNNILTPETFDKIKNDFKLEDAPYEFQAGLQLSAYALMFNNNFKDKDIKLAGVNFLGLEDGNSAGTFDNEIKDFYIEPNSRKVQQSMTQREAEANFAVNIAGEIIKTGIFKPDYDSEKCKHCGLKGICRRSEFVGESLRELENNSGDDNSSSE